MLLSNMSRPETFGMTLVSLWLSAKYSILLMSEGRVGIRALRHCVDGHRPNMPISVERLNSAGHVNF